jgi:hypothetical protein
MWSPDRKPGENVTDRDLNTNGSRLIGRVPFTPVHGGEQNGIFWPLGRRFAGQEAHSRLLADGAAAAPDSATPLEAVAAALDALTASFTAEQREFGPRLLAVIAGNPELQERAAFKHAALAAALTSALGKRGVPDLTASLAADLGVHAFDRAFDRWIEPSSQRTLTELAHEELQALRTAAMALG